VAQVGLALLVLWFFLVMLDLVGTDGNGSFALATFCQSVLDELIRHVQPVNVRLAVVG
jgi:hypothetical protein